MVQIIDQPGSIAGRIGKGFAQGLSEQLPKEIDRSRLSKGLKEIGEQKDLSPFEQASRVLALPGGAESAHTLLPLLQQQNQNKAFFKKGESKPLIPNKESTLPASAIPKKTAEVQQSRGGLASPSEIKRYKQNLLQEPTQQDVNNLASDYIEQGIVQNRAEAVQLAQQELTQNLTSQNAKNKTLTDDLNSRIALDLQKGGLGKFGDVAGEIQKELLDQGEYLVNAKGKSPQEVSQEIGDIVTNLGKTSNKTKQSGSFENMFRPARIKDRELREQKKDFEKYGFAEQFDDVATSSLGITPMKAAQVLDPLKNELLKDKIGKLKQGSKVGDILSSVASGTLGPLASFIPGLKQVQEGVFNGFGNGTEMPSKSLDEVVKSIEPTDNLMAIAYEIRKKNLDVNQFLQRVSELSDSGEIAITPRQKRQLERPVNNSLLGDILYESL